MLTLRDVTFMVEQTPSSLNMDPENHWLVEENTWTQVAIGPGSM